MYFFYFKIVSILLPSLLTSFATNQKPFFHITPDDGHWMNDPNGPYYDPLQKEFHLFAQYNPFSSTWGNMSWMHWASKDMVKWIALPVAIYNDEQYDIGGAFSGSAIIINTYDKYKDEKQHDKMDPFDNVPMLIYTCVDQNNSERQCIAISSNDSDPNQSVWKKSSHNPIMDFASLPKQYNDQNFRDPAIWPKSTYASGQSGYWVALAAELNQTGNVVLYDCYFNFESKANDFETDCKYFSQFWESSPSSYSTYMVECPDFYPLPLSKGYQHKDETNLYILKYSVMEERRELYEIGYYNETEGKFLKDVENHNFLRLEYDFGANNHFYASKTFSYSIGGQDRRILWGWSPESDSNDNTPYQKNWSGCMALPREVRYSNVWKVLTFNPIDELSMLRKKSTHYKKEMNNLIINGLNDISSSGEYLIPLPIASSVALEVRATFHIDFSVIDEPSTCNIEVGFLGRTTSFPESAYETVIHEMPAVYTKHVAAVEHQGTNVTIYSLVDLSNSGGSTISTMSKKPLPGDLDAWLQSKGNHNNNDKDFYGVDIDIVLYYDQSIVEMYLLEGISASTARIYPDDNNIGLSVYVKSCDNNAQKIILHSIDTWEVDSIWSS